MKKGSVSQLVICAALLPLSLQSISATPPSPIPVDLEVPIAPTPVKANGEVHLLYELHITNFRSKNLELTRAEVFADNGAAIPETNYVDAELTDRLARPGAPSDLADKRVIGGGMRAVLFLDITVHSDANIPGTLRHRLSFKPDESKEHGDRIVESAQVAVSRVAPVVISPPVRGDGWLASDGLSNNGVHRRTIVVVDGKARIAQRFATDWTRIGQDGQVFHGDPANNANWRPYGAEVLAVTDATVTDIRDGIPENNPTSDKKAVPIDLETAPGNYIILNLGNGRFAFYAHLQPKSVRVRMGDKVRRGQVIALLGNSGNADAPHLHFHISDGNSPLGAEGVPYVFASFEVQGVMESLKVLTNGEGWKPKADARVDRRQMEIPARNAVVRFP